MPAPRGGDGTGPRPARTRSRCAPWPPGHRRTRARPGAAARPARSRRRSARDGPRRPARSAPGARTMTASVSGARVASPGLSARTVVPGGEVQLGLGGPRRPRVERDGAAGDRAGEEERQTDRHLQRGPLRRPEPEVREGQVALGHRAVALPGALAGEQQVAAAAGAQQRPAVEVDHVGVRLGDRLAAHLAPLSVVRRRTAAADPPQRGDGHLRVHRATAGSGSAGPPRAARPTARRPGRARGTAAGAASSASTAAPARRTS